MNRHEPDRCRHYARILERATGIEGAFEAEPRQHRHAAHNEAAGIQSAIRRSAACSISCAYEFEIVVVDDGSRDDTFDRAAAMARGTPRVKGLRFSRNFGKEAALLAGLQVPAATPWSRSTRTCSTRRR